MTAYKTYIKSTLPVSGPFFSADGTVFATAALDTNQMKITVWSAADFSILYKEVIQDDREEMFYRSPQVCLFSDLRRSFSRFDSFCATEFADSVAFWFPLKQFRIQDILIEVMSAA
ncbi:MAG: hypothetical protein K2G55_04570 [Lachnospiraceae bacterium]|nr:hypothetical protein [Lachnospiraceae bacterium]MDE7205076.1 hypothetical protein [Lachnospiraceae bacterium]